RFITFWRYVWPVLPPILLCGLFLLVLLQPLDWWLHGDEKFDEEAMIEWVREARPGQLKSLPELTREYVEQDRIRRQLEPEQTAGSDDERPVPEPLRIARDQVKSKKQEIEEQLKALANPPTRMFPGQLPLFPVIYRLTVESGNGVKISEWDSDLPRQPGQYRRLKMSLLDGDRATATVEYNLHAYTQRQVSERQGVARRLWLSGLGAFAAVVALIWIYIAQRRERERQRRHALAEHQFSQAGPRRLQEELR